LVVKAAQTGRVGVFGLRKSLARVLALSLLVGLPVLGAASAASALSNGCGLLNGRSGNANSFGEDGQPLDAGDQVTVTATLPASSTTTAVIVQVNGVTVASTPFPGTVSYTFPTSATPTSVSAGVDIGNAQLSVTCAHVNAVTAPTLTVPADITLNATSPSGANVTYSPPVSATDPGGVASLTCSAALPATTNLAGGSFPIGTTTVNCTATDTSNNTASGHFQVHVKGAAEQLADLATSVSGVGDGKSLSAKIAHATARLAASNIGGTCRALHAFINEVNPQNDERVATPSAAALIASAQQIRSVLGCPVVGGGSGPAREGDS
jgi:hypothetical protein